MTRPHQEAALQSTTRSRFAITGLHIRCELNEVLKTASNDTLLGGRVPDDLVNKM